MKISLKLFTHTLKWSSIFWHSLTHYTQQEAFIFEHRRESVWNQTILTVPKERTWINFRFQSQQNGNCEVIVCSIYDAIATSIPQLKYRKQQDVEVKGWAVRCKHTADKITESSRQVKALSKWLLRMLVTGFSVIEGKHNSRYVCSSASVWGQAAKMSEQKVRSHLEGCNRKCAETRTFQNLLIF